VWKVMFIITLLSFIVVYISGEMMKKFVPKEKVNNFIFLGYWVGLLFPIESKELISFYSCAAGYLILIVFLVLEKKMIEYVDEVENTY